MTKKDYILIANTISDYAYSNDNGTLVTKGQLENLIDTFIDHLEPTNPLFDAERFRKYVYTNAEEFKPNTFTLPV